YTDPWLNSWVGRVLGNPSNVACVVRFSNGDRRRVTLLDLGLQPLDVLTLAPGDNSPAGPDSELHRRVVAAAAALAGAASPVLEIQYGATAPDPAERDPADRTFPDILELARSINALLTGTRALQPRDLAPPEAASN